MKILVTGAPGFIGFYTCLKLIYQGNEVYGIDNFNDYYNPKLKFDRLKELGFNKSKSILFNKEIKEMYPMQQGDVHRTFANVDELIKNYIYSPSTDIKSGIISSVKWFKSYKAINKR